MNLSLSWQSQVLLPAFLQASAHFYCGGFNGVQGKQSSLLLYFRSWLPVAVGGMASVVNQKKKAAMQRIKHTDYRHVYSIFLWDSGKGWPYGNCYDYGSVPRYVQKCQNDCSTDESFIHWHSSFHWNVLLKKWWGMVEFMEQRMIGICSLNREAKIWEGRTVSVQMERTETSWKKRWSFPNQVKCTKAHIT